MRETVILRQLLLWHHISSHKYSHHTWRRDT